MSFDYQQYNADYLSNASDDNSPITDAADYGVKIVEASVVEGETYWKVIGVHHLTAEENRFNHHVYLAALDENGKRLMSPPAWAGWTWEGRRSDEAADPVLLDKPSNEPAGNIAMHPAQKVSVWIKGLKRDGTDVSDRVEGIHTRHPNELGPNGELWNAQEHHSFYIVFQRVTKTVIPADGIVSGRIENGAEYKVRLTQGNTVYEQVVDSNNAFRFERLRYGAYQLEAIPPTVKRNDIQLNSDNKEVIINLTVS